MNDNCAIDPSLDDLDGDGIGDTCDNCPSMPNPAQTNSDEDASGDACDNCPEYYNPDQKDTDGDGVGERCDVCPSVVDPAQADTDNDFVGDSCDNCTNTYNPLQADIDQDGIGDACSSTSSSRLRTTYRLSHELYSVDSVGGYKGGPAATDNRLTLEEALKAARETLAMTGAASSTKAWS
ncbi:MAG TPA: thrombospondin type 3 repeat-containing protein [Dehalococcoidia bacterium]|nr:thrombospondin type 3 repeat-containing protein [Dehalococcoidia bacterium]